MKKLAAALLATALLLPAGAALAVVDDQAGVLSPDARAHLEQDLSQFGSHHFDVVITGHSPGSLETLARQTFTNHHLGSGDGVIALAVNDHRVFVHLGNGFKHHGVGQTQIQQHLRSDFYPLARQGHYDVAVEGLAKGLMGETHEPATSYGGSNQATHHHAGFPWGFFLVVAAIGAGAWWVMRQRGAGQLLPRIKQLEAQHAKIVGQALRLDDVETLGRFREGAVAKEYGKLATKSADLMGESRDFGESLLQAKSLAAKGKKAQAEPMIDQLERRVVGLGSDVAAALTTLDRLEGTAGLTGDEGDLPRLVQRLSRRLQELKSAYSELRARAAAGYNKDGTVESRLAEAERLLTTAPVDAKAAEEAVLEATDALETYRRTVEGENDRVAMRQGAGYGGWAESPSYLPYVMLPSGYQRPYFYSTYYEPPMVVYNDAGGWGGGNWGGSDAGGSWDDSNRDAGGWDSGSDAGGSWDSGGDSGGGWDSGGGDFGGGGDW